MRLIFLGTGTSTGVPQLRCHCPVCTSLDPRDKRLRASALLEVNGVNLLIDCGPDFRQQMLSLDSPDLDALLITHSHYDHVGGVDDLRPYCTEKGFPVYCRPDVAQDLRDRVPYCFASNPYPGAPRFTLHEFDFYKPFEVKGVEVMPLQVNHYRLEIAGFRIGKLGYITDAKKIYDRTVDMLKGVDTLVINALRHTEHISHITIEEALAYVERIKPRQTWLTHIAPPLGRFVDVEPTLPNGVNLAYDGLSVTIDE